MEDVRAGGLAERWQDAAPSGQQPATEVRYALQRALETLVADGRPAMVLTDDDAPPLIGVVTDGALLLLDATATEESGDPTVTCRRLSLEPTTEISVTQTLQSDRFYGGVSAHRRWTITPAQGESISFQTRTPGVPSAEAFVRALTQALGWTLPDS